MAKGRDIKMIPSNQCPFLDQYEEEEKSDLFCIGCINLIRSPEYDYIEGLKVDYRIAFTCKKDCMNPDIYYEEIEPVMPWE